MFKRDPVLAKEAVHLRASIIPEPDGRALLTFLTVPQQMKPGDPVEIAIGLFLGFLINPHADRLAGPCPRCDRYFVGKTRRQTVYCSRKCARKHTAKAALQKRRQHEHIKTLVKARHAIEAWKKTRTKLPCKDWVAGRTLISKHWLTRAERNGELQCLGRPPLNQ